jgi:hypothetical protein
VSYFKSAKTMDELKAEYRRLALENHPDKGGSVETMQEINADFEILYRVLKLRSPQNAPAEETATSFRAQFYTQNGWAGSRYDASLSLKEISQIVRGYVKDVYPTWRFSVTTHYASMCQELTVCVMEGPMDIFDKEKIREEARLDAWRRQGRGTEEEIYKSMIDRAYGERAHIQNWESHNWFTDSAQKVLDDIYQLVQSYNRNDCDSMIDYFDVNFYTSFDIGKWDKPFKVVPRIARIAAGKGKENLKRIAG